MTRLLQIFSPAPHIPELTDEEEMKAQYSHWRLRVFCSMFMGYALYYFTRKSFTFAMPSLMANLGFDKGQLGILGSVLSITYGISKFASGILGDKSNPRYFMAFGLFLTGVFNILFGLSSSLFFFALFWGLNGWFQGFGWPACARLLTHWYSQSERGRWWSWWNTSHNIGGALIPILAGFCAQYYGWRSAMIIPGCIAILGSFFLMKGLCDTPQSLGLPPIEVYRSDFSSSSKKVDERDLSVKEILFGYVLNNPLIWLLGLSYFFVYIIRTAVNDWSVLYLVEAKGYSQFGAGGIVFWFEIGGFFGSLFAGYASDKIFKGGRGQINVLFSFLVACVIAAFWANPAMNPFLDSLFLFLIGFFVFGPQMLIGMAAAELAHKNAAATSTGFVGWIAYIGAAGAGYPIGKIAQEFGWNGFFFTLTVCAFLAACLLIPLWNVRSNDQTFFGVFKSKKI
ncbi:MAG: MFS transporter [Chlamydia sp.]